MIRGWAVLAIAASASAFTATPALAPVNSRIAVTSLRMSSGRVNKKIELDSPKVASQVANSLFAETRWMLLAETNR
jgi:hypothetical protein